MDQGKSRLAPVSPAWISERSNLEVEPERGLSGAVPARALRQHRVQRAERTRIADVHLRRREVRVVEDVDVEVVSRAALIGISGAAIRTENRPAAGTIPSLPLAPLGEFILVSRLEVGLPALLNDIGFIVVTAKMPKPANQGLVVAERPAGQADARV